MTNSSGLILGLIRLEPADGLVPVVAAGVAAVGAGEVTCFRSTWIKGAINSSSGERETDVKPSLRPRARLLKTLETDIQARVSLSKQQAVGKGG